MGNRWLWALGLLLVLAAGAVFFWMQPQLVSGEEATRVLILGLDEVDQRSRSDTIIVAQADDQGVLLMSIPRDLRLKFPDGQLRKVNAAYSQGSLDGGVNRGAQQARQVVEDFLGVSIPYYVVVDFAGFRQAVDQIGGVEILVESVMDYDDNAQDLHIHLAPGLQQLDGEQALQYARYRDETGDLARIQRQQQLIKAILDKQELELNSFEKIKTMLEMALSYVKATNLSLPDLVALARQLQRADLERLEALSLDGDPLNLAGVSYLEPRILRTAALVDRYLRRKAFLLPSDVHVVVLNGVGAAGLAGSITRRLEQQDFVVDYFGNAEQWDYADTWIITMDNDEGKAQRVNQALGGVGQVVSAQIEAVAQRLGANRLRCAEDQTCDVDEFDGADVVVIAGADFPFP